MADTTPAPIGADAALALLVAAVEAETDPSWECNSYHPSLWSALNVARAALATAARPPAADLAGDGASTKDEIRMTDNKQYPELPTHFMLVQESFRDEVYLYTADQMRAYVDADRAMRAGSQGDALDHGVREELSIGKAINRAARDLPEGWEIRIDLERHAGVVFLIDPDGNETMSEGGELFSDQINAAIDAARGAQGESNG